MSKLKLSDCGEHCTQMIECEYKDCNNKNTHLMFNNDGYEFNFCGTHWDWGLDNIPQS